MASPISIVCGKSHTSNPANTFNATFYSNMESDIAGGKRITVKHIAAQFSMTPVAARAQMVAHYGQSGSKFIIGFTKGRTGGITLTAA